MDFERVFAVYDELHRFVSSEPLLHDFRAGVWEVRERARLVAAGHRSVVPLNMTPIATFPSRALAERAVEILAKLPPMEPDDEDRKDLLLAGQLLGNLVTAFTHALMHTFPDLLGIRPP